MPVSNLGVKGYLRLGERVFDCYPPPSTLTIYSLSSFGDLTIPDGEISDSFIVPASQKNAMPVKYMQYLLISTIMMHDQNRAF